MSVCKFTFKYNSKTDFFAFSIILFKNYNYECQVSPEWHLHNVVTSSWFAPNPALIFILIPYNLWHIYLPGTLPAGFFSILDSRL